MWGIDAHRHGSDGGHSLLQGIFVAYRHINVAGAFGTNVFRLETALAVLVKEKRNPNLYFRLRQIVTHPHGGSVAQLWERKWVAVSTLACDSEVISIITSAS